MEDSKKFGAFYTIGERKVNTWCTWNDRLDPYGCGCQHDCSYCYAKSLLAFRGLWNAHRPSVSSAAEMQKAIRKLRKDKVIRIGGMTDPFMPQEETYRATMQMIRYLNRAKIHYLIVTKSDMVADDEYIQILDKELAHIQITITTTDDKLAATYEHATPPSRRIAAVEKLQALGYDVQVRLSPYIPEYVDVDKINAIKCDKILIEFLKVSDWVKKWFKIDYTPYSLKVGGYYNLQLDRKVALANKITGFKERSVGEFVPAHHEYFSKHFNANPKDCCNLRLPEGFIK